MKHSMKVITLRMALFLLIANVIMAFVVDMGSAEWYITLVSISLMLILITVIKVIDAIKAKNHLDDGNHKKNKEIN